MMPKQKQLTDGDILLANVVEKARNRYATYVWFTHNYPDALYGDVPERWVSAKAPMYVADRVQKFIEQPSTGAYDILIISLPPQHGKSQCVTETLPSWYLGKNPNGRVILISYNDDTAKPFMRKNKDKIRQFGRDIFGIEIGDVDTAEEFELTNKRGGMISRGIGSGITGRSADCLPAGTMILTEHGEVEITRLLEMKNPPLVLSYNHTCGIIELNKIIATRKVQSNDIVTIRTSGGREIKSTSDHRHYEPERGYKPAHLFAAGDSLYAIKNMPNVRNGEVSGKPSLSGVFRQDAESDSCSLLRLLSERIRNEIVRISTSQRSTLLFARVCRKREREKSFSEVCNVRSIHKTWREVLLSFVSGKGMGENGTRTDTQESRQGMPDMRGYISTTHEQNAILFSRMCQQGALTTNEGSGKLSLQRRNELRGTISPDEARNQGTGWIPLCLLRGKGRKNNKDKPSYTSCRREPVQQRAEKFDYNVSSLPYDTPQIERDTVSEVIRNGDCGEFVYDIQVEGNHNFFANGILVHNCIIVDDPIKNREDAESEIKRNLNWNEWTDTITTRLSAGGKIILIMTRWHEDDLAGRILANEDPARITLLRLPCEAEENDILGRRPGDALCPEFGKGNEWLASVKYKFLHSIDQNLGVGGLYSWNALYQGRPSSAEGNQIKRHWWKFYDEPPEWIDETVQSWDCTFKDTAGTDNVAGQVWGRHGADCYLLDRDSRRMDIIETMAAIRKMTEKWPKAITKLVEDKANGPAVIQLLRHKVNGLIAINPAGGKVTRVNAIIGAIEAGNVWLPRPDKHPWVNEFIEQCAQFPNGKHDDDVDAMSQALNRLIHHTKSRDPALKPVLDNSLEAQEHRRIERIGRETRFGRKIKFM